MQKWEYLTVQVSFIRDEHTILANNKEIMKSKSNSFYQDLDVYINSLGEQGWEMVSAQNREGGFYDYYFKRPIE